MSNEKHMISLEPVGVIRSCFTKKFGIPRQPGLVNEVSAVIELLPPCNNEQLVRGLEGFSHIWILFLFHDSMEEGWKNMVRPPRLGGKKRVGVFASRSPFRPNPIGISAVKLEKVEAGRGKLSIHIKGADLMNGTPVIDIKPYLPYADAIPDATGGYAVEEPEIKFEVLITGNAKKCCEEEEALGREGLSSLIINALSTDPRPAYYNEKHEGAVFGLTLWDMDFKWKVEGEKIIVSDVEKLGGKARP